MFSEQGPHTGCLSWGNEHERGAHHNALVLWSLPSHFPPVWGCYRRDFKPAFVLASQHTLTNAAFVA